MVGPDLSFPGDHQFAHDQGHLRLVVEVGTFDVVAPGVNAKA